MPEKIVLIDGHSILNRAFYGLPDADQQQRDCIPMQCMASLNIMFKVLEEEQAGLRGGCF